MIFPANGVLTSLGKGGALYGLCFLLFFFIAGCDAHNRETIVGYTRSPPSVLHIGPRYFQLCVCWQWGI